MKKGREFLIAFAISPILATSACAHAMLLSASPAVGAAETAPPGSIRLKFSEKIEPRLSEIRLTDESGHETATGKVQSAKANEVVATVDDQSLSGRIEVYWRVVSVDGHATEGRYHFLILTKETLP